MEKKENSALFSSYSKNKQKNTKSADKKTSNDINQENIANAATSFWRNYAHLERPVFFLYILSSD